MNDQELIALLRERLHTVETAIHDFMDVMERTGKEREETWAGMVNARQSTIEVHQKRVAIARFLHVYERTIPERQEAAKRLTEALTTDFRTFVGRRC